VTLSIRNPEADSLARRLAELDRTSITDAVVVALKEAISARTAREPPLGDGTADSRPARTRAEVGRPRGPVRRLS